MECAFFNVSKRGRYTFQYMKKLFTIAVIIITISSSIWAAKAKPGLRTYTQPDGSVVEYVAHGDEDFNYLITTDGVLLVKNDTGLFVASVLSDGTLEPTSLLAHMADYRSEEETRIVEAQDKDLFFSIGELALSTARARKTESLSTDNTLFPHSGSPRAIVLLIQFSDVYFSLDNPASLFDKYLNYDGYFTSSDTDMGFNYPGYKYYRNYGSVRKYFEDMSFGQYTPQFDLYGPYTLASTSSTFSGSSTAKMKSLISAACSAADDDIDFSEYDENGDGYVDLVYIIYAGYAQSWTGDSDDIWPNSGTTSLTSTFDGMKVRRYGVNNELNFDSSYPETINGIGLFCHEFSHCLGLPDLYPSSTGTAEADNYCNQNLEYWDLMDAGEYTLEGFRPTAYSAWERERFGWLDIEELTEAANVTLETLNTEGETEQNGNAYRIRSDENEDEYYILENIQQTGWNTYVYGHGMTVMHVEYEDDYFQLGGYPNATAGHPRMSIIAADNLLLPSSYYGTTITNSMSQYNEQLVERYLGQTITSDIFLEEFEGDPFPGSYEVTSLTDDTTPSSWTYTTSGFMGKPITEIAESDDGIITLKFMGGDDTGIAEITLEQNPTSRRIYSIDGIYMGTDTSKLPKGVYIIGGKRKVL